MTKTYLALRLSKRNGFFYEKLGDRKDNLSRQYDPESLDEFVSRVIMENPKPSAMNRHIHFVNFTQLDRSEGPNPIYINSLRDPLGMQCIRPRLIL